MKKANQSMNSDIKNDIFNEIYKEYINNFVNNIVKDNPSIIKENKILEIEYNIDGSKKDIYSLASERDIKLMQIKSDKNELDYLFSGKNITKEEYDKNLNQINKKISNLNLLYDDLIFNIINTEDFENIKSSILNYNLNNIDLDRLKIAIRSVTENKIEEFRNNNKLFMIDKISYWNYKYDKISKQVSKSREVEMFINDLIKK